MSKLRIFIALLSIVAILIPGMFPVAAQEEEDLGLERGARAAPRTLHQRELRVDVRLIGPVCRSPLGKRAEPGMGHRKPQRGPPDHQPPNRN